jgi:hypothetical protein
MSVNLTGFSFDSIANGRSPPISDASDLRLLSTQSRHSEDLMLIRRRHWPVLW